MRDGARAASCVISIAGVLLTGCQLEPAHYSVSTPERFDWAAAGAAVAWPDPEWFRGFGSEELAQLVKAALADNLDLAQRRERIVQADERARQAHAAILPQVNANPNMQTFAGHASSGSYHETDWAAVLSASYEVDFWGKNRAQAEAARDEGFAARADRDNLGLTTEAGVADTYFTVLSLRERLGIARANVDSARTVLGIVEARFKAGLATPLEVAAQAAAVASLEVAIPGLEQSLTAELGALAVLLGRAPEQFDVKAQSLAGLLAPSVSPGLPAEILRRRPDIAEAEANLAAAHANLEVARAQLLPALTLTGNGGIANPAVNAAVNALSGTGPSLTVGASLVQSVFDAGRLRAARREAAAHERELLLVYRATILAALTDVETSLAAIARLESADAAQQALIRQAERALEGARLRYEKRAGDFLAVLEAQRTLYAARDEFAQYRLARLQAAVSLCKALGGGWTIRDIDPDARLPQVTMQ